MSKSDYQVIGINVLRKNGADVDEILNTLIKNASVEFTAYYYLTNIRAHCTGPEGEHLKGIIEDARMEDLSHYESCIQRIFELGGTLPRDAQDFIGMSGCEFLQLPDGPIEVEDILKMCLKAEQGAVVNWNRLCNMTLGKDPVTYDLAKDVLKEEIEHEAWFLELLHGRPSGQLRRSFPGESPHTRGHSRSLDRGHG